MTDPAGQIKDYRDVMDLRANLEKVVAMQKPAEKPPKKTLFSLVV